MLAVPAPAPGPRPTLAWPDMEDCPLNEFKTQGLCTLCSSALFPYGKRDLADVARRNKATFAEIFRHLMQHYDGTRRGEHYRFAIKNVLRHAHS